jgi:hypothetical protein
MSTYCEHKKVGTLGFALHKKSGLHLQQNGIFFFARFNQRIDNRKIIKRDVQRALYISDIFFLEFINRVQFDSLDVTGIGRTTSGDRGRGREKLSNACRTGCRDEWKRGWREACSAMGAYGVELGHVRIGRKQ